MRILHVSDCYLPRLGGIEIHLRDLVRHQRADGQDAHVLTTTPAEAGLVDETWVHRINAPSGPTSGLARADASLRVLLAELEPDVVHVHVSIFSPFATLAGRRASSSGLPTVVTVHSMWSGLGPIPGAAHALLRLGTWDLTWSAVSEAAAAPLRTLLGPGVPVHVLPNAVDPSDWRPASWDHQSWGQQHPLTVTSVMRMTRTKRTMPLGRILRAIRRDLPAELPVRAVVIGAGPQSPAFERYLRRHGMDDWVGLRGRLDRTAIRDELENSSVFLAPAELESFGIAALEARTAGLPVVASARSGVTEFVTHGIEGLLGDSDAALARHVTRLLTDDVLRARISQHNAAVPPHHDWVEAGRRTSALYLEAVSTRTRSVRPLDVVPAS
jgi:glycosyltransferase involved in cell wall biosynthesis